MEKFNVENFNAEEVLREVEEKVKKPNILICGATGVGKSSLVNDLFGITEAEIGQDAKPQTKGVHLYTSQQFGVNLYDSEGYEVSNVEDEESDYEKNILSCIEEKRRENLKDFNKQIHEVWYCISAGNKRVFEVDARLVEKIRKQSIPVMIVITKIDQVDEQELDQLKNEIAEKISGVVVGQDLFTYSTQFKDDSYVQKDKMIKWALDHLSGALRDSLIPSLKGEVKLQKEHAFKKVIPKYAGLVITTVTATSFIAVPFSDSVPLMALQTKMVYEITSKVFGINSEMKDIVSTLGGTSIISYIGKTLAAQILGVIPFFGNVAKGVVNVSVAVTITVSLGAAMTLICENYMKQCIENGTKVEFFEYVTPEILKEAIKYVDKHKKELGVDELIKNLLGTFKKEK